MHGNNGHVALFQLRRRRFGVRVSYVIFAGVLLLGQLSCYKEAPQEDDLIAKGRELFRSVALSADGQTSCETCHPGGHMDNRKWHFPAIHDSTNGQPDSLRTLTLWGIAETGPPYLWNASRMDLHNVTRLYVDTIMGGSATDEEVEALVAYQKSLKFPKNPWRNTDGSLTDAQARGKRIYETKGFCTPCHPAPSGTTGKPKDIGTGGVFKTPGLRFMFEQGPYFHDGRSATLGDVIEFYKASSLLKSQGFDIQLSAEEKADLIEYMKSF